MKINFHYKKEKILRALVYILELLALAILLYIFVLPAYPLVEYKISTAENEKINIEAKDEEKVKQKTEEYSDRHIHNPCH